MSVYIVVHKLTYVEAKKASDYLYQQLHNLYPWAIRSYHNGQVIFITDNISMDFRCGTSPDKFGGLRANYYYTDDNGSILDALEQSAGKVQGKRLYRLDDIVEIVSFYMNTFHEIDKWLENKEKESGCDLDEKYNTCGRCVHDGDGADIRGSTCYLCRRNATDNRIDWFEERKN